MNFLTLKYFVDMAELGSVTAAAQMNFVAQQSMSAQLKKLERHYGAALFYRTAPLRLTAEGRRVYDAAVEILRIEDATQRAVRTVGVQPEGDLVIGLAYSGMPPFFGGLLGYMNRQPEYACGVQVRLDCAGLHPFPDEIELYLALEAPGPEFDAIPLFRDRTVLAVTAGLLGAVYGARRGEVEARLRQRFDRSLVQALPFVRYETEGLEPSIEDPERLGSSNIALRTSSVDQMTDLCRAGQCAAFLKEDYARRVFQGCGEMRLFPLRAEPNCTLSLYFRRGRPLSRSAERFLRAARQYLAGEAEKTPACEPTGGREATRQED